MISAAARYGHALCLATLLCTAACGPPGAPDPVGVVDLIGEFDRAERRPRGTGGVGTHTAGGLTRPAIIMPVPGRATWSLRLPRRAELRTFVALEDPDGGTPHPPVRLRVGIANRVYEELTAVTVPAGQQGWIDVRADLSDYAGRKWSLFYRPDRMIWNLVLAADAGGPGGATAFWGMPQIVTDVDAAREYVERR